MVVVHGARTRKGSLEEAIPNLYLIEEKQEVWE